MRIPNLNSVVVKDKDLSDLSRHCAAFADAVRGIELLQGRIVDNVAVTTAAFDVPHGLGRAFRGYIIVRCIGATFTLYEATSQPDPTRNIRLVSSADGLGSLWVF